MNLVFFNVLDIATNIIQQSFRYKSMVRGSKQDTINLLYENEYLLGFFYSFQKIMPCDVTITQFYAQGGGSIGNYDCHW